jgi:hypothetical protein
MLSRVLAMALTSKASSAARTSTRMGRTRALLCCYAHADGADSADVPTPRANPVKNRAQYFEAQGTGTQAGDLVEVRSNSRSLILCSPQSSNTPSNITTHLANMHES